MKLHKLYGVWQVDIKVPYCDGRASGTQARLVKMS